MVRIRRAVREDVPAMNEILNECILNSVNNLAQVPRTDEEALLWFEEHRDPYPIFVAEEDGVILGWASLSIFRNNQGYLPSVENSVYVHREHQGKGIGKRLLETLIQSARDFGHHTIVALITEENAASIRLHQKAGFIITGNMLEVGAKFGRRQNVTIMQFFTGR